MDFSQKVVFILGMHRSGTSAITGALQLLGLELGKDLMEGKRDNEKGFFEHNEVVKINDGLLATQHASWDHFIPLPPNWEQGPNLLPFAKRIEQLMHGAFGQATLIGIKDPRLSLTLPFWQKVLTTLGIGHNYVIALRHPLEISESLKKRNHLSEEKALLIWVNALINIERNTRSHTRTFVSYEALLDDPQTQLTNIAKDLSIIYPNPLIATLPQINDFFSKGLKHHKTASHEAIVGQSQYVEQLRKKFFSLLQAPNDQGILAELVHLGDLHDRVSSFFYHQEIKDSLWEYWNQKAEIEELIHQVKSLSSQEEKQRNQLSKLANELSLKEQNMAEMVHQLKFANNRIAEQFQMLVNEQNQLNVLKGQLHKLQADNQEQLHKLQVDKQEQIHQLQVDKQAAINAQKEEVRELFLQKQQLQSKYHQEYKKLEKYAISLESQIPNQGKAIEELTKRSEDLQNSISYKVGLMVTAPARLSVKWFLKSKNKKWVWVQIFIKIFSSPWKIISHLWGLNIKAIIKALREEKPTEILKNIKYFLGEHNLGEVTVPEASSQPSGPKAHFKHEKRKALKAFLENGQSLSFRKSIDPTVSIILVLYNQAELTFSCLQSIQKTVHFPSEVIIIDNGSSDDTRQLLGLLEGVEIVKNKKNKGFLLACNYAAKRAKGKHLLFLNNDAQLLDGSLEAAVKTLEASPSIGAVGGRIILLDGKLQEAGSIIWNDGSCLGYGRGADPERLEFMFRRDVDYCSGVFLLTPREVFEDLGGFDDAFVPAYYEETDYCLRLWQKGLRVVYEPAAKVVHYEFGSSEDTETAIALQIAHQQTFYKKHKTWLEKHFQPSLDETLPYRFAAAALPPLRILFIEDMIPHMDEGSGFPRTNQFLWHLVELGCFVSVLPFNFPDKDTWQDAYKDLPRELEILLGFGRRNFVKLMEARRDYYDIIWLSRPHNIGFFQECYPEVSPFLGKAKIVYDAEAIFANRDLAFAALNDDNEAYKKSELKLKEELKLAQKADVIIAVNEKEAQQFRDVVDSPVYVANIVYETDPITKPFSDRSGLLFVGNMNYDDSPNVDSIEWLVQEIYPHFTSLMEVPDLVLIGSNNSKKIQKLAMKNSFIKLMGRVDELKPYFEQSRIFVAPTRYGAGSPLKALQAAAFGIPIVCTNMVQHQLGWPQEQVLLAAPENDPVAFARNIIRVYENEELNTKLSQNVLKALNQRFSVKEQKSILETIISAYY